MTPATTLLLSCLKMLQYAILLSILECSLYTATQACMQTGNRFHLLLSYKLTIYKAHGRTLELIFLTINQTEDSEKKWRNVFKEKTTSHELKDMEERWRISFEYLLLLKYTYRTEKTVIPTLSPLDPIANEVIQKTLIHIFVCNTSTWSTEVWSSHMESGVQTWNSGLGVLSQDLGVCSPDLVV